MNNSTPTPYWRKEQERSSLGIMRFMVKLSLLIGRKASRVVLFGIAFYFSLTSPRACRHSMTYLKAALNKKVNWFNYFRHILYFSTIIHDRIYFVNNRLSLFSVNIKGSEKIVEDAKIDGGAFLIGAHLGSFEALRATGYGATALNVSMLMDIAQAEKLTDALTTINPEATQDIIALGQPDSMINVSNKLEEGRVVGMLADRTINASDPVMLCSFLGKDAPFPLKPWQLAAILKRKVFFMTGLYLGGNRYSIHIELIADFKMVNRENREVMVQEAVRAYSAKLEYYCQLHSYNWFNFFNFWEPK